MTTNERAMYDALAAEGIRAEFEDGYVVLKRRDGLTTEVLSSGDTLFGAVAELLRRRNDHNVVAAHLRSAKRRLEKAQIALTAMECACDSTSDLVADLLRWARNRENKGLDAMTLRKAAGRLALLENEKANLRQRIVEGLKRFKRGAKLIGRPLGTTVLAFPKMGDAADWILRTEVDDE